MIRMKEKRREKAAAAFGKTLGAWVDGRMDGVDLILTHPTDLRHTNTLNQFALFQHTHLIYLTNTLY